MLRLLSAVLLLSFSTLSLAQDQPTFRVGTVNYNFEGAVPSVGTFVAVNNSGRNSVLSTVTMPNGKPLFDFPSPLSKGYFRGTSSKAPQLGIYRAVLEDKTVLEANLNPNALLPPVENLSVSYLDETLKVTWTPVEEALTYIVSMFEEGAEGNLARREVQTGPVSFSVALEPGDYLVVVRAYNFPVNLLPFPLTDLSTSETSHILSIQ